MTPPRLATSLLWLFAPVSQSESLIGDLVEQYQNGRSRWWYWRQVLTAIAHNTVEEACANRWRALSAVAVGWLIYWPSQHFLNVIVIPGRALSVTAGNWLLTSGHDSVRWWWMRSHATDVPASAMWWITCACLGWLIARTLGGRSAPLILVFVASVMMRDLIWISITVVHVLSLVNQDQRIGTLVGILRPIGAWISLLTGGLWAARRTDNYRQLAHRSVS